MALTRPFAPPERRRPTEVPPGLAFLTEHPLTEADLGSRPIESFRCEAPATGTLTHDTLPLVYHMDRSDYNRHTNMHVYPQQAQDYLALAYHRVGGDAGRLRFRGMTIYFRRPFLPGEVADVDIDLAEEERPVRGRAPLPSRRRPRQRRAPAQRAHLNGTAHARHPHPGGS